MSVYNGLPYLQEAVDSILSQDYDDFEFVVIDDGSSDATWQVLTEYATQDERMVLLQNPQNIGYTRSLNRGIEIARGELIARQDADDVSFPGRLGRQVSFLRDHPQVGLVGALPQFIDQEGQLIAVSSYPLVTEDHDIKRTLLVSNCIRHGSIMLRRRLLEIVGMYDPRLEPSEDYDLWLRLAEVTALANLPEPLYKYREHAGSESNKRRFVQMYNKAVALERAAQRRRATISEYQPSTALVARDYLRAAVIGMLVDNRNGARASLDRSLELDPSICDGNDPIVDIVWRYAPKSCVDTALEFCERVFDDLAPQTRPMIRAKNRVLSRLHMQRVFEAAAQEDQDRTDAHLWQAVRRDPSWLRNRGVIALLIKSAVRR